MRQVIYQVAASLDGYIAGPDGEIDWIVHDPTIPLSMYESVDTVLLGRRTYEMTQQPGAPKWPKGWRVFVFSRTLRAQAHRRVTVVSANAGAVLHALRAESGGDIWLFGGASLFATALAEHAVDRVDVAVMPVLLGGGVPLAPGAARTRLQLTESHAYPSGIVSLRYAVERAA
ncbi:MAG: dihydrofolate reductase family protein [Gemmatimonadaceae bacterium]